MKTIKCCYCNERVDPAMGIIQHNITKKTLCVKCAAKSMAGFLIGIAPHIHSHPKKASEGERKG